MAGLLARTGSLSGHPSKQQPRSTLLDLVILLHYAIGHWFRVSRGSRGVTRLINPSDVIVSSELAVPLELSSAADGRTSINNRQLDHWRERRGQLPVFYKTHVHSCTADLTLVYSPYITEGRAMK
ncbi:hypothetical protein J6590_066297 [Homalodisca vitripennis]|nr:hypothetical protein J6590_066297 [Homalodisca vitripennis]